MVWKNGKKWVYSITYDEGCADLLKFAAPVHRRYDVPGHIAFVSSQVGVVRDVPGSTYNGMMILSKEEFHRLRKEGWGASCHGMTHAYITEENIQYELYEGRKVLEAALEYPIMMFCLPGDNSHFPIVHAHAARAGYLANMTLYDEVNTEKTDLFRLGRCALHTQYPGPFFSAYDPYKRIHQAMDLGGWIIDYCHCPMPGKPLHPHKDCTTEELEERFKTVRRVGGDEVWIAEPNEVLNYILHRR